MRGQRQAEEVGFGSETGRTETVREEDERLSMGPAREIAVLSGTARAERDETVLSHLPLVRAIAVRVYENLPVHVDFEDLVHAGILGLFDAVAKYDGTKQVSFQNYAKHRVRGAMLDSLREADWASRDLRRRHRRLEEVTRELAATAGEATEECIAEKMGMDITRWRQVAIDLRMVGLLSGSARPPESENQETPEFPANGDLNPDVITVQNELRRLVDEAMKALPPRYQTVIRQYYARGRTMREIGSEMGINESRVSQIHRAALDKLNEHLQAAGIHSADSLL